MSKQEKDCPVEEALCYARMNALDEKIKTLKTAIYLSSASVIAALTILQLIVNILRG
jgi:hypothetical protein